MNRPRLSPALFALVCLSFLLPFATVSCDKAKTSFTGIQLVTHTVPAGGAVDDQDCHGDLSACVESRSWLPTVALVAALTALLLGLLGHAKGQGWLASAGFLSMLGVVGQTIATFADVTFGAGYYVGLGAFFCAMCLHGVYAFRRRGGEFEEVRPLFEPQPGREPIV